MRVGIRGALGGLAVRGTLSLPALVLGGYDWKKEFNAAYASRNSWDKAAALKKLDPNNVEALKLLLKIAKDEDWYLRQAVVDALAAKLEEKAKAAVLLMRLKPEDLKVSEGKETWNYQGIVAYSKICTHVGCPVALYEQQTHHLLCPCHQSQFDITEEAKVIFGPAKRPLPQLPIEVDDEGYLVAQSDFHEPVGPSFWERSL